MQTTITSIPELQTQRLSLVALSLDHSAGMYALWSCAEVYRHAGPVQDIEGALVPMPPQSPSDSDKIIQFWTERAANEKSGGFRWALILRDSGEFVGITGFNSVGPCSEYAYHLQPSHWGRGLMFEASRAAVSWLAEQGICSELEAFIEPQNVRSVSLAQRLGFTATDVFESEAQRFLKPL